MSISPSPSSSATLSSLQSHPRFSFGISARVPPSVIGILPSTSPPFLNHVRTPCAGVVHLTDSPASSSAPSSASSSPSAFSADARPSKVPRSRASFTASHLIASPLISVTVKPSIADLAPPPRARARFIIASDSDHDPAPWSHPDKSRRGRILATSSEDLFPNGGAGSSSATDRDVGDIDCNAGVNVVENLDTLRGLRRWHALMEIVQTEAEYLRDLRKLVNVYLPKLRRLPLQQHILDSVAELARSAFDILIVHERFIPALREASTHAEDGASVDEAIERVANLFICEAESFDLYQYFCSVQPETLRLLRSEQGRPEWKEFEKLCARGDDDIYRDDIPEPQIQEVPSSPCLSNMLSPESSKVASSSKVRLPPSAFQAPHPLMDARSQSYDTLMVSSRPSPSFGSRLRFQDLLIKPVQRICKYPLMLEGLRNKRHGMSADIAVAGAIECMRGVTMRVDEARRQRDNAEKAKLVLERIEAHPIVTRTFIESLGVCMLAGSFDVVYHHHILTPAVQPVRIKYVGAFLYPGGYLLLVKSGKGSKMVTYRLKYWFNAAPFNLVDIPEDDAVIAHAFRLSYADHHFEISAACEHEKYIWIRAIYQSRRMQSSWIREPLSCFYLSASEVPASPTSSDNHASDFTSPSTITPLSPKVAAVEQTRSHSFLRNTARNRSSSNPALRLFSVTEDKPPPLLKRVPQTERDTLDRDLSDVLSDIFISLRSQAQMRDEVIFPPPKFTHPPQAMAIATTGKLVRRGSQIITQMSRSTLLSAAPIDTDDETGRQPPLLSARQKAGPARARGGPILVTLMSSRRRGSDSEDDSAEQFTSSPKQIGQSSSPAAAPASSVSESENHDSSHPSSTSDHTGNNIPPISHHRRASSLVGSFKGLVRRVTNKRHSLQHQQQPQQDTTSRNPSPCCELFLSHNESTIASRRRVSSAPPCPPTLSLPTILRPDSIIRLPSTQMIHDMIISREVPAATTSSSTTSFETPSSSQHSASSEPPGSLPPSPVSHSSTITPSKFNQSSSIRKMLRR